ncbi:MAG TPA: TonB-dependent receptor [Terriglobales bacterium]|nr:TonB-dependent receptor [Terriglobales bacterium]
MSAQKIAVLLLFATAAFAQKPPVVADPETVVVTGTFTPIPLSEANRAVLSLNTREHDLLFNSFADYLQLDPSIDLRQRGTDGIQADLSIRGASFGQSLVLLNGMRINDAQSAHHNLDIPVPLEAVSSMEVLHGAGSTLYGSDAMGGAVNFITAPPPKTELRARAGLGNFGFNQERIVGSYLGKNWSEQISASRDFSTGFRPDRDYRSSSASSDTWVKSGLGQSHLLFAGSDRPFGADQFYGSFPSWERTKSWFASMSQDLGKDTNVDFAYRRHSDEFVLLRDNPSIYENNHISQSWQGAVRRNSALSNDFKLAYGVDAQGDVIDSNNLGHHSRNRGAGYINGDFQLLHRVFLSLGARDEVFTGGRNEFAPSLSGGVFLGRGWKLRASASRAFRLPTYTDLYYSDPANLGNPLLKPESAWSFEGGPEWNLGGRLSAEATVFHRRERNDIDYVRSSPSVPWQATNIDNLNFTGVEAALRFRLPKSQELNVSYTALHGSQEALPGLTSKYVFEYPSQNAVVSWMAEFKTQFALRTRLGVLQRIEQDPYPLWDFSFSRTTGWLRPYLQLSNLSNTEYEEIPGVAMPGRSVIGGLEFILSRRP